MTDILTGNLIKAITERIKERDGEIASRIWVIYKRSKLDHVDKADITAELLELYEDIEGTVTL